MPSDTSSPVGIATSMRPALFGGPDSELAATVHQTHQVPHAIVVAELPRGDRRVPQSLDELRGARVGRRQAGHGIGGDQGGRVRAYHLVAIQGELVSIGVEAL